MLRKPFLKVIKNEILWNANLLVVFGNFHFSIIPFFVYHINLLVQFFAQSLHKQNNIKLLNRRAWAKKDSCSFQCHKLPKIRWRKQYTWKWCICMASVHIRELLMCGAFPLCYFSDASAVTCTYLKVLQRQTRQLKWRDSLPQSRLSLQLLLLLFILQHHSCCFQQLGLSCRKCT